MTAVDFSFDHFPQIELDHFRLRQLRRDDAEAIFAYLSDGEVIRYRTAEPLVKIEEALEWIKQRESEFQEERVIRWGIARKEDDRIIGTVLFHNWEKQFFRAEIGYDLSREYWGRGVMTEVLQKIVAFGFQHLGLYRIEALLAEENVGSRRVLEKNGFEIEGTLHQYWLMKGKFENAIIMGLLKERLDRANRTCDKK